MRITRLRISDFKAHAALEIEPAPGLTIIRGPNEAGKSTIQQAVALALFRKPDSNREDVRQAWGWTSESPPEVTLEFEADGEEGALVKRFDGSRARGELRLGDRSTDDYAFMQEQVARLTGIPSEAFFRATASVGHAELEDVGTDEPVLHDRLQKAISGADRGTGKAKKKLEAAIRRYRTEGPKNPGLLKVAREEIAALEAELTRGEGALARLEADRAAWVEAHERREQLDVSLRRLGADLAEAQRAEALAQRRDAAQDRYDRLKRATELATQNHELRREMPTAMPLNQLRSAVSRADSLQFELSELEAEVSLADAATDREPEMTPPRPLRWLALATLLVVLGWAVSLVLVDAGIIGGIVVAVVVVGVVLSLLQAVRMAARRRRYGLAMQLAESAAAERAEADQSRQEQLRRTRRELEAVLGAIGAPDVEAAEALLATVQTQTEALARIEGELRGLGVDEDNIRRLEEARDQAANEAEQARHALAAMGRVAEDPGRARAALERQLATATPTRDRARSEEDQAQGRIDANQVDAEVVAGLAERLAAARERLAELERRVLVYEGTLAAIEAAERATLKTAARYLEERMGPIVGTITDGRYDDIEVDEKTLGFRVRAPETGELVSVDQLSRGTADQLFLAARLGLVQLVTLDRRPPLILDDPFVTFDQARGERALRLVKQFASERGFQVLYLTCSDRFDALADELVVLPGPSRERVLARPAAGSGRADGHAPEDGAQVRPADGRDPAAPRPTLRFAPDPRRNPDPVAPRRDPAGVDTKTGPEAASRRSPGVMGSPADPDTGVVDPFGLRRGGNGGSA